MGLATFIMVRGVEILVVIVLFVFMPGIPPSTNFTSFKVAPSLPLEGKLALNGRLNGVQHLFEKELKGPEAFADFNGELYTSVHGGEVVKLVGKHIVHVAKFGKPCKELHEEHICGRPLGMNFNKNGLLYVADAYNGIWEVDVKTGRKTQLVSMDEEIDGKKPKIPNSLAVSKTGDVYWTDSSTEFKLEDGVFTFLADASGRLIHYNPVTKKNTVLMKDIHFANGVALSSDEEFLIVAETAKSCIHRYYLKGPKKGTHDIFINGLPGLPDNLKSDGKDGFLVPLVMARDKDYPVLFQVIGPFPLIRKFFARIFGVAEASFQMIENVYPNFYSKQAIYWIGHFEGLMFIAPQRTTVLHLSRNGEIIDAVHGNDKSISGVSEVHIFKDDMYFGSPFNNYVGKLPLTKAGLIHLRQQKEEPVKQEKPKQAETVKPTAAPIKTAPPPTAAPVKTAPPPTAAPVKTAPPPTAAPVRSAPPPTAAPVKSAPPPTAAPVKSAPPPTAAPVKSAPPPTAAPVKSAPPPTAAPVKSAPPPTAAPVKQAPPSTAAPVKQAPPPAVKQAPPPVAQPVKQAPPPTAAPQKQSPPPTVVPVTQAPPTAAPVKQAPPPAAAPVKQAPPPAAAPVKQAPPPTAAPVKQAPPPTAAPVKQAPPPAAAPVKQAPPPAAAPVKQTPPPTAAPIKVTPPTAVPLKVTRPPERDPAPVKQNPAPEVPKEEKKSVPPAQAAAKEVPVKQTPPAAAPAQQAPAGTPAPPPANQATPTPARQDPPVVPVKEKMKPKSESIPSRK